MGMALAAPGSIIVALEYDRQAILTGEIWRLWTGHLVHFSLQQAFVDAFALSIASALVERAIGTARLLIALVLGAPCISLGLMLGSPDLLYYRGASGIAVMMAISAGGSIWPRYKMLLTLLLLSFVVKTAAEAIGVSANLARLPAYVVVAWQAHLLGAICGALMTLSGRFSPGRMHQSSQSHTEDLRSINSIL